MRSVIRYLGLKEIHENKVATLGEDVHLYSMAKKWAAVFKRGKESLEGWIPTCRRLILVPSDDYLLPKMNKELGGHYFSRDDDVMNAVDHFPRDQNGAFYTEGIRLLHGRCTTCVNARWTKTDTW